MLVVELLELRVFVLLKRLLGFGFCFSKRRGFLFNCSLILDRAFVIIVVIIGILLQRKTYQCVWNPFSQHIIMKLIHQLKNLIYTQIFIISPTHTQQNLIFRISRHPLRHRKPLRMIRRSLLHGPLSRFPLSVKIIPRTLHLPLTRKTSILLHIIPQFRQLKSLLILQRSTKWYRMVCHSPA